MNERLQPPSGVRTVFLHIGTFKTGTTYLQNVLGANHEVLADQGVLFPGGQRWREQSFAVHDLLGNSPRGAGEPRIPGAWNALVSTVTQWTGHTAIISVEFLTLAHVRHVRKVVRAFAPAEVHVVLTARDLGRVIPAMWQEGLKVGNTRSWKDYVASVVDGSALAFWNCQDLTAVLDTWEAVVPRERIHVVTVPPTGAPPTLLLERFCTAVGLPAGRLDPQAPLANESMGAAEAEALRRLNVGLGGRLNERQYRRVTRRVVARRLMATTRSGRVALSPEDRAWAAEQGRKVADVIAERGYRVVGDLDDLVARGVSGEGPSGHEPCDTEVLDAAMRALTEVTEQFAKHWWTHKSPDQVPHGRSTATRIGSTARSSRYKVKRAAFALTQRNRAAARAAAAYRRLRLRMRPRSRG